MKKKTIGIITTALILTMISGTTVMAAEITVDNAVKTALEKAGVAAADASVYKKIWEFSDGKEQYDIHFLIPGQMKYEYEIDAVTGEVLSGESDVWEAEDDAEYKGLTPGEETDPEEDAGELENAVLSAMKDAGLDEGNAVVCKAGVDFENGKKIYDINFLVTGQAKYDYEIEAATGNILRHEKDAWEPDDDLEYKGLIDPVKANADTASGELTEEKAAAIAIMDAGLTESDVTVTECRRETDDGIDKYEISFRSADGAEYDYEIDAANGTILDKDMEYDD